MKSRILRFTLVGITGLLSGTSFAQEAVLSSGVDGSGSGGSISFSVGQVAYVSNSDGTYSESQGVQQPYVVVVTSVNEESNLEILTYPNPTTDAITLKIGNQDSEKLSYQLFDLNGKLLRSEQVTNGQTTIPMDGLSASTYILNVIADNKSIKTFNIIKNQ